ncbi:MAG: amino acid permease C-terminal domain-containing protein, partial [Candidatus Acidiferrum sp.]
PDRQRGFRVPFVPFVPILSVITCLILMASLTLENWIRFFVWMVIGLVIYLLYSRKHSTLRIENRA